MNPENLPLAFAIVSTIGYFIGMLTAVAAERFSWRQTLALWKDANAAKREARALERVNRETFASSDHAMFAMRAHDHFERLKQERDEARHEAAQWEKRWAYQVDKRSSLEEELKNRPAILPGMFVDFQGDPECDECGSTLGTNLRPTGKILCCAHWQEIPDENGMTRYDKWIAGTHRVDL